MNTTTSTDAVLSADALNEALTETPGCLLIAEVDPRGHVRVMLGSRAYATVTDDDGTWTVTNFAAIGGVVGVATFTHEPMVRAYVTAGYLNALSDVAYV